MNIIHYFLLSLLYFWASSTALSLGVGYYTVYRPVIAGFLTGLILKDPFVGMTAGAVVNIIYIDFVSTGGSFKGDQCLTAIIAAIAASLLKLSPIEAAASAYPFGFLGILIWKYRLNINSVFVKIYENKYEMAKRGIEKRYPDISIYDGLFPQLILYFMSTAVILAAVFIMILFYDFIVSIKESLFFIGLFLVFVATWNIIYKLNNKKSTLIFIVALILTFIINPKSYIVFIAAGIIVSILANKKLLFNNYSKTDNEGKINKKDLMYSWFIWMNFSHSCYSYERLQGMAFAHSMKNIFKKLYESPEDIALAVHKHSEHFNTEPNMGTPIHGHIISLEEKLEVTNENNILFIKKGMMGIAAGLGDSYTQVVLTPLFISMSLMLCLDNSFTLSLIPIAALAFTILIISYSGFMQGYYEGKESLIERINIIKNSRVKKYFPFIFAGILGVSLGKLLMLDVHVESLTLHAFIGIISVAYATYKNRSSK
ncbi:MAG: PTS system mannose/fructose/sorbose family transporter subunit IID [Sedimentibacter sp.]